MADDVLTDDDEYAYAIVHMCNTAIADIENRQASFRRYRSKPKILIDICAGDHSMAKYYLRRDPKCRMISIDIIPKKQALRTIPKHMWGRIVYFEFNVKQLTEQQLALFVQQAYDASMSEVYHIHASPDCRTLSIGSSTTTYHGAMSNHMYRCPDGTPNPNATPRARAQVHDHDLALNAVLSTMSAIGKKYPHILQTCENPRGFFAMQPKVIEMQNNGWVMRHTNYCAAASPVYDGDATWAKKPTDVLMLGGETDLQLPQCNNDCPYRIHESTDHMSTRHRAVLRTDARSHPGQIRIEGPQRHAIPGGLFDVISKSHDSAAVTAAAGGAQTHTHNHHREPQSPAGLFMCMDESHERQLLMLHRQTQSMHMVECKGCSIDMFPVTAERQTKLQQQWRLMHARYGHQSSKRIGLKKLKGFKKVRCPTCLAAKICRKAHSGQLPRGRYALDLVHTDLQEFREADIDGNKYSAIFVDDYTDRKWSYLAKRKSDFGAIFKRWLADVGTAPTTMRSDVGGEYIAAAHGQFLHTCLERGIKPERSVPGNPEQNAKAERGNRNLLDIARSLLLHAHLPKNLWGYAMRYAAHIDMRCESTRAGKTPYEAWYGHKCETHPITFGAQVYFRHNERNQDPKLDPRGHRAIFLGYPDTGPGCYVQDCDMPGQPIRLTNDVSDMSIDELTGMGDPSVAVSSEDYELLLDEFERDHKRAVLVDEAAVPMIATDRTGITDDAVKYWHSYARFAEQQRAALHETMVPEELERLIKEQWKTKQLSAANEMREQIDANDATAVATRASKRLRKADAPEANAPTLTQTPAAKHPPCTADKKCEKCNSPHNERNMLLCDGCDKGYHIGCIGMPRLPRHSGDWLCHACVTPGLRISKYWQHDKSWHDGTVTFQYAEGKGTDIEYDDGCREQVNLNTCQWRPTYTSPSEWVAQLGLYDDIQTDAAEGMLIGNIMQWCPKTHTDILKASREWQERWLRSEDKEWNTVIEKKCLRVLPLSKVPRGAAFIPSKWVYRVKADGSLKSRLCLLGDRMPPSDLDKSAPTPRLSSVRLLMAKAIQEEKEFRILDLSCAFLNSPAQGQTYVRLPPGRNKPGYAALLLANLYGSIHAPRAWHNMLHNWFAIHGFAPNPHDPCIYSRMTHADGTYTEAVEADPHAIRMHAIVHVDDIGYLGTTAQVEQFRKDIEGDDGFKIDYLGRLGVDDKAKRYLGIEVERTDSAFILHNQTLITNLLAKAGLSRINSEDVPMRDIRLSRSDCPTTDKAKAEMAKLPYRTLLGQIGYYVCPSGSANYALVDDGSAKSVNCGKVLLSVDY